MNLWEIDGALPGRGLLLVQAHWVLLWSEPMYLEL
jgi:hypothetical protein